MGKGAFSQIAEYYYYPDWKVEYFVPREHLLREIEECHQVNETTSWANLAVLHGLGGCGKTQLALDYCERTRRAGTFDAIFWIDASSPATIMQCYITMAATIFPDEEHKFSKEESVRPLLDSIETWSCSWLLVFDNVDGSGCFEYNVLRNFVPQGKRGHLLFTCRDAATIDFGHSITTSQMSEDESLELLFSRSQMRRDETTEAAGIEFVSMLGYSALAIDSAAAYIDAAHIELDLYTVIFEQCRKLLRAKLEDRWDSEKGIFETNRNTYTSIELSFQKISEDPENGKRAKHLLNLLAFLGGKAITEELFQPSWRWIEPFYHDQGWDEHYYKILVARFHKFSLVQTRRDETGRLSLTMHSLVQERIKHSLRPPERQRYVDEVIRLIYRYIMHEKNKHGKYEANYRVLNHLWSVLKDERELCPDEQPKSLDPVLTNFMEQHWLSSEWRISSKNHD